VDRTGRRVSNEQVAVSIDVHPLRRNEGVGRRKFAADLLFEKSETIVALQASVAAVGDDETTVTQERHTSRIRELVFVTAGPTDALAQAQKSVEQQHLLLDSVGDDQAPVQIDIECSR